MLSKEQFLNKHKAKYSTLSATQKNKRYRDYINSAGGAQFTGRIRKAKTEYPARYAVPTNNLDLAFEQTEGGLTACAQNYLIALTDPWDCEMPPCIPDQIALPSYKFQARTRFKILIGNSGLGFAVVFPYNWTNNARAAVATLETYNSINIDWTAPETQVFFNDSRFTQADVNPQRATRLVGAGLKVRYMGNELQKQGRLILYRTPTNGDMLNLSSPSTLLGFKETMTTPVEREEWHAICFRPARTTDLAFSPQVQVNDAPNVYGPSAMLIAIEAGASLAGQSFEADFIQWFEMIGANVPEVSHSDSDPIGLSAVLTAMSDTNPTTSPLNTLAGAAVNAVANTVLSTAPYVANSIAGARSIPTSYAPNFRGAIRGARGFGRALPMLPGAARGAARASMAGSMIGKLLSAIA